MVKSPIHHTANEFMPNEYQIRKYAINLLDRWDYYYWYPARTKFKTQVDIFGVYDIIAFKDWMIKYIQFTTTPNLAARRKKVQSFIERTGFRGWSEVWGWDNKKRMFKIERVG